MWQGALRLAVVRGTLAVAALSPIGCARQPPLPLAPSPAGQPVEVREPVEREPVRAPEPRGEPEVVEKAPASDAVDLFAADPIVTSGQAGDEGIDDRVEWWLNLWQTRSRDAFVRGLSRMGSYEDLVTAELAARDLPPSLLYLPLIEANYYPTAVSPAGAGGLWQFMPRTARWMGLTVNSLIDQRFDAFAATPLALDYLLDLNEQFQSWFLTLAAYNAGPGRVEQAIQRHGRGQPRDDRLFLRIRDRLPAETRDFIPKFLAAVRMASDPERHGISGVPRASPPSFDTVAIDGPASIDVIADVAGVGLEEVRDLNPHIVLGMTPGGGSTVVRLPAGSAEGFAGRFAAIPLRNRVNRHIVSAGETLSHIALDYRISLAELRGANPGVSPRRLQIGSVLIVPGMRRDSGEPAAAVAGPGPDDPPIADDLPEAGSGEDASSAGTDRAAPTGGEVVHVVTRGESLWLIARLYGVELARLRARNGIGEGALVHPGDSIRIPAAR